MDSGQKVDPIYLKTPSIQFPREAMALKRFASIADASIQSEPILRKQPRTAGPPDMCDCEHRPDEGDISVKPGLLDPDVVLHRSQTEVTCLRRKIRHADPNRNVHAMTMLP
jgi:hypothetical protein